jgi:hypothetical protein
MATAVEKKTDPAPESAAVQDLVKLLQKADPETQKAMRDALGVGGAIQKKRKTQSNADAKRIAYSVGEVQHPEGFEPKPSEATVQEGPEAVAAWLEAWHARNSNPSSKAEEYAAVAHM